MSAAFGFATNPITLLYREPPNDAIPYPSRRDRVHTCTWHLDEGEQGSPSLFSILFSRWSILFPRARHSRHYVILSVILPARITTFTGSTFDNSVRHPRTTLSSTTMSSSLFHVARTEAYPIAPTTIPAALNISPPPPRIFLFPREHAGPAGRTTEKWSDPSNRRRRRNPPHPRGKRILTIPFFSPRTRPSRAPPAARRFFVDARALV